MNTPHDNDLIARLTVDARALQRSKRAVLKTVAKDPLAARAELERLYGENRALRTANTAAQ